MKISKEEIRKLYNKLETRIEKNRLFSRILENDNELPKEIKQLLTRLNEEEKVENEIYVDLYLSAIQNKNLDENSICKKFIKECYIKTKNCSHNYCYIAGKIAEKKGWDEKAFTCYYKADKYGHFDGGFGPFLFGTDTTRARDFALENKNKNLINKFIDRTLFRCKNEPTSFRFQPLDKLEIILEISKENGNYKIKEIYQELYHKYWKEDKGSFLFYLKGTTRKRKLNEIRGEGNLDEYFEFEEDMIIKDKPKEK